MYKLLCLCCFFGVFAPFEDVVSIDNIDGIIGSFLDTKSKAYICNTAPRNKLLFSLIKRKEIYSKSLEDRDICVNVVRHQYSLDNMLCVIAKMIRDSGDSDFVYFGYCKCEGMGIILKLNNIEQDIIQRHSQEKLQLKSITVPSEIIDHEEMQLIFYTTRALSGYNGQMNKYQDYAVRFSAKYRELNGDELCEQVKKNTKDFRDKLNSKFEDWMCSQLFKVDSRLDLVLNSMGDYFITLCVLYFNHQTDAVQFACCKKTS